MNKREIFDKVRDHLLAQNAKSLTYGSCLYRGPDGTKCAVGCLIPDDLYSSQMEGAAIFSGDTLEGVDKNDYRYRNKILLLEALLKSGVDVNDGGVIYMLGRLQSIHDSIDVEFWAENLADLERDLAL